MAAEKILVIDDEPDVVSFLSTFLSDEGFEVETARDGPEGLSRARSQTPDLITLDITMPGMSGIEVLTELRRDPVLEDIPVIIVTGVTAFKDQTDFRDVRAPEGFIPKPVDLDELIRTVRQILGGAS